MGIKSPQTYGDYYWQQSVEAALLQAETFEAELAPFVSDIIKDIVPIANLRPSIARMLNVMSSPPHPAWSTVMSGWATTLSSAVSGSALNHAMLDFNYKMAEMFSDLRIDASTASLLWSRKKITEEMFDARMKSGGLKNAEASAFYEAMRPYPSVPDIMAWARYQTDPYNIKALVWNKYDVSIDDFELWEWLSRVQLSIGESQSLFKRGVFSEIQFDNELGRIGYEKDRIPLLKELAYSIPNAMLLMQGNLFRGATDTDIIKDISKGDVHPDYAGLYYDSILTKPSPQDLIAYQLRTEPQLNNLSKELRKIGVHPYYHNIYRELAYPIPPVADIITMAVREAFTPAIASKFGQYEDLPPDYVKYVGMKGLSKEWAERYWAAHWNLPSPMQGFDMLHRGIIKQEELVMLLRALDVMPFWRDKLIQLAYNVYNRIDVRRMYALGILDKAGVYKAYIEMGYNEEKAKQLTDFVVVQQIATLTGFTSRSVVSAYSKGLINQSQAVSILSGMKIPSSDINSIMDAANHKKEWELKSLQIDSIENLYKKKSINESTAYSRLSILGISSNEITLMLDKWKLAVKAEKVATWTAAQTLSMYKKGVINQERAIQELIILGYDEEHIAGFMANTQTTI